MDKKSSAKKKEGNEVSDMASIRFNDEVKELVKRFKDLNGNLNGLANEVLREVLPKAIEKKEKEILELSKKIKKSSGA